MTNDQTALERAVEEARENVDGWRLVAEFLRSHFTCDVDALILAARLAERARVREAVEKMLDRMDISTEPIPQYHEGWDQGIRDTLAAIDQMETP